MVGRVEPVSTLFFLLSQEIVLWDYFLLVGSGFGNAEW